MAFDHDRWMRRSAERQDAVQEVEREAHDFVDRQQVSPDNPVYILLSWSLIQCLMKKGELPETLKEMVERKAQNLSAELKEKSQSEYEYEVMVLALSKKMLESGTNRILSNLGIWESKTFQEGQPSP